MEPVEKKSAAVASDAGSRSSLAIAGADGRWIGAGLPSPSPAFAARLAGAAAAPLPQASVLPSGRFETVLLVEDNLELADVAQVMLEGLCYTTRVAHDGAEAIRYLEACARDDAPDLLFSDVIMPGGVDGYGLAERARELHPRMKVLLTSGYDRHHFTRRATGSLPLLPKPYQYADLAIWIRRLLDGHQGRLPLTRMS